MTFVTAVPILFASFVYRTNVYWSVIHGIKRKPHLSVAWNWYHFVAIAILHQPRPTDSADINTRLQLSDTSSIPPIHGGFLLISKHSGISLRSVLKCRIGVDICYYVMNNSIGNLLRPVHKNVSIIYRIAIHVNTRCNMNSRLATTTANPGQFI